MALIILQPNATSSKFLGSGSDVDSVFGTGGNEIVFIADNGKVVLDPSFSAGVDTININGNAGDYDVRVVGSNIVLTNDDGADITIPAGTNGTDIVFLDATRELIIQGGGLSLGDQDIPADGTLVEVEDGDVIIDPPVDGEAYRLSSVADDLTGTGDNDVFRARVSQVSAGTGAQGNELGSGDFLDGGAGTDTLDAWVQGATTVNGTPGNTSIAPETTDVEILNFRAVRAGGSLGGIDPDDLAGLFFGELGPKIGVEVDASNMFGVNEIASIQSDESLTVFDVTTLADDGETIRATGEMTVRMDHTGNNTSIGAESDLTVLFDRDYLICEDELPTGGQLFIEMMDVDAALLLELGFEVYPEPRSNAGETIDGPLDDSPFTTINFTLGATNYVLDIDVDYNDYPGLLAQVQAAIASQPELAGTIVASLGPDFQASDTDGRPGGTATGRTIVLTNVADDREFTNVTLDSDDTGIPGEKDFHLEPYTDVPEGVECKIEIDVVLDKVGRGGDGGELTIGGMVPSLDNVWDEESESGLSELARGIEQFNVSVEGNDSEDSSLAAIRSTDNWLRCIIIADEGDSEADLVIGNRNTAYDGFDPLFSDGILGDFSLYQFINGGGLIGDVLEYFVDLSDPITADLSSVKNNAIKDVLVFDASAFDNDTETHAFFSDEVVDKYLNITDSDPSDGPAPDATDDNADGDAVWTFGEGQNIVNVNISQTNMAVEGSSTREDFQFNVFTNGGDDLVQIQLGDGFGGGELEDGPGGLFDIENWYINHLLNDNLYINTGSGDDKVETWGSTAADIVLGDGSDIAFTDNSGVINGAYNDGRATWVFNAQNEDIDDLVSFGTSGNISGVANLEITVQYMDFIVTAEVGNSIGSTNGVTINDLSIVQAIKDAINNNPVLNAFLVAEDGPGRTLVVRNLVDGELATTDLTVTLGDSGDPLTAAQSANPALLFFSDLTAGQLSALGFDLAGDALGNRFDADFAFGDFGTLDGVNSENVNNNRVEGGLGNDEISLSTNELSIEHLVINGVFSSLTQPGFGDHVLNFDVIGEETTVVDGVAEVQTLTFAEIPAALGDDPFLVTITLGDDAATEFELLIDPANPATDTPEEIAAAVATALNLDPDTSPIITASVSGAVVTLTYDTAGAVNPVIAQITAPDGTEVQAFDIDIPDGVQDVATTLTVNFAGQSFIVNIAAGSDQVQIEQAIVTTIQNAGVADITASIDDGAGDLTADGEFTLVYSGNVDPAPATFVFSGGTSEITVAPVPANDVAFDPFVAEFTVTGATTTEGVDDTVINLGQDIIDLSAIIGPGGPGYFDNDAQVDGIEGASINGLIDSGLNGVILIDGVEADDAAGGSELARIQNLATTADNAAQVGTNTSVIISVTSAGANGPSAADTDGTFGDFYQVVDGAAAGDAQVTYLGRLYLGGSDLETSTGNFDAMTADNFTPLSPTELMLGYGGMIA